MMLPIAGVAVGGDAADLGDHVAGDGFGELLDFLDGHFDGLVDAALEGHRIGPRGDRFDAFAVDCLGQNGGRGGAVAGDIGGLRRHLAHHLGAHVFERILQLDLFGDRDPVLGDGRSAIFFLQNDVASTRSEGHFDRIGELVDSAKNRLTGMVTISNLFCHDGFLIVD